ncbi:MAG: TonB-dependent receptor [Polyangiales bacterium]
MVRSARALIGLVLALCPAIARAQSEPEEEGATVRATRSQAERDGRAGSAVTRQQMDERVVRSAPDALRYTPGVSVQQTAHGQASPYIRGMTGQQVLHLFDGVRLNNGIFRQGPNQYFFTVDAQSVDRIDVERGAASVVYGADAIGGAIIVRPQEPVFARGVRTVDARARAYGRFDAADLEPGGRAEGQLQVRDRFALVGGVGYRVASELRGGAGGVRDLRNGRPAFVPVLESDGATQHGTGFRELTFDARGVLKISPSLELVGAVYGYRQFDAPRTDQCPAPDWSPDACLTVLEQFRTLAYVTLRGNPAPHVQELQVTASYQRYHERRRLALPQSLIETGGVDDLDTLGITARASTGRVRMGPRNSLRFRYGFDAWRDEVRSSAYSLYVPIDLRFTNARGLYLDGSKFFQGGAFVEVEVAIGQWLIARAGGRLAFAGIRANGQASTQSASVNREWAVFVGRAGLELKPHRAVTAYVSVDQGFRPPNLDDTTSRAYAAGGFQFENPALDPEYSTSFELGSRVRTSVIDVEVFGYGTRLEQAMTRTLRNFGACPANEPQCAGTHTRLQLVNSVAPSWIVGGEAAIRARFGYGFEGAAQLSYAWGEGPNPLDATMLIAMSRIPPLQGSAELRWTHAKGIYVGAAVRWAADQTRLSIADQHDPRIPRGGTPGYGVVDLRAGWRFNRFIRVHAVFENLADSAWRVHGSSINGAGRGLLVQAAVGW